jgi:hypothetical protein
MYYSSGNYEAFAHPKKPEGVDHKYAYIVGTGLAALTAACYLVRDAQMKGDHIHIFEKDPIPGGACDGYEYPGVGYVMRGGREMDNHFEVMWDLFRSIPSIETEGVSILDEYYWLNKADPNYSLCRATVNCGEDAHTDGKFAISDKGALEIMRLFFTPDEQLYNKKITDFFFDHVYYGLDSSKTADICYEKLGLTLSLCASDEFKHMVVYTPFNRPGFCLENQTNSTDYINMTNMGVPTANMLEVAPGQEKSGWITCKVK